MKNNITYIGLSFITSILFLTGFISVLPINITEQDRSLAIIFILPYFISFVSYGTLGLLQCIKKLNLSSLVAVISGLIVATGIPLLLAVFNIELLLYPPMAAMILLPIIPCALPLVLFIKLLKNNNKENLGKH